MVQLQVGDTVERDKLLRRFVDIQYTRNDMAFTRGTFRVRGDTIEIFPAYEELAVRIEMFGDEIERLIDPAPADRRGDHRGRRSSTSSRPRTTSPARSGWQRRSRGSRPSSTSGSPSWSAGQAAGGAAAADAHHLRHRDDAPGRQLLRASRTTAGTSTAADRAPPPNTLLDYFPEDFLLVIDESHVTVPADRRHVQGRHVPQAHAGRARLPAAVARWTTGR